MHSTLTTPTDQQTNSASMFGSGAPRNTLSDMPTLKTNFIDAAGTQQFLFFTKVTRIDKNGFLSPQERSGKDVECVMAWRSYSAS